MSKNRASLYALSVAILALIAYKSDMGQTEIALWEAILGLGFVAAMNVVAFVKTWPRKSKEVDAGE